MYDQVSPLQENCVRVDSQVERLRGPPHMWTVLPPRCGRTAGVFLLLLTVCGLGSVNVPRTDLSLRTGEVRGRGGKAATSKWFL